MITNNNFPAALAVLAFLGTLALLVGLLFISAYGSATRRTWTRYPFIAAIVITLVYIAVLLGFSYSSHDRLLALGEEKYFCELDCHLAYSIAYSQPAPSLAPATNASTRNIVLFLRTRFDETTISPQRPKGAPLTPNPRAIVAIDDKGRRFDPTFPPPASEEERPLTHELRPGDFYLTPISFSIPVDAHSLRLLLTSTGGPELLMIGGENSLGHKKAYFLIEP